VNVIELEQASPEGSNGLLMRRGGRYKRMVVCGFIGFLCLRTHTISLAQRALLTNFYESIEDTGIAVLC